MTLENRGLWRCPGYSALGQAQAGGEGENDGVGREETKNGGISSLFLCATNSNCLVINSNQIFHVATFVFIADFERLLSTLCIASGYSPKGVILRLEFFRFVSHTDPSNFDYSIILLF